MPRLSIAETQTAREVRGSTTIAISQKFDPTTARVAGRWPSSSTRAVVGSNYCDVTVVADQRTNRAVCVSAIDNLGKGGAANGVQNLNIMFGWGERAGLEAPPVYP